MKTQEKNKYIRKKSKFKKSWNGVPATVRRTLFEASLYESVFASLFWHIIGALLIWGITFSFLFFGIMPKIFPKSEPKIHDIEFIIKNPSRHRNHSHRDKAFNIAPTKTIPNIQSKNTKHQNMSQPQNSTNSKNITKSKSSTPSKSEIPDFSIPMPNLKSMSSGLGDSSRTKNHATGLQTSNPSIGDIDDAFSKSGASSNRSGFDKNTTRKIITTYDISPYVNELKRNIRWNWKAPKDNGNKRVELFLRIAKDGRVIILNVKRTSEVGEVDNAALNAVRKSMPLNPLPTKYSKSYLDIIFTFDSNSIGSRY